METPPNRKTRSSARERQRFPIQCKSIPFQPFHLGPNTSRGASPAERGPSLKTNAAQPLNLTTAQNRIKTEPPNKKGAPVSPEPPTSRPGRNDYIIPSIPPIPPMPPPWPPPDDLSAGRSAIIASVVISKDATDAASSNAIRTTLAGSITPN